MMSNYRTIPLFVPLLVAVTTMCGNADAAQVPIVPSPSLDDLVDDPLDPGDDPDAFLMSPSGRFRFDNFTFNSVPSEDFVPDVEDVFVTLTETANSIELLFQIVGKNLAGGPEEYDFQLGYEDHATNPLDVFSGHELFVNGVGLGDGEVVINEEILDGNDLIGQLTTFSNIPNQGTRVIDTTTFGSRPTSIRVDKDIALNGGTQNGNGVAFLSHFEETLEFERIPEPSSILLLTLAALGLGVVLRTARQN